MGGSRARRTHLTVVAASAALVAPALAGCGSGTDGRPLTAFEQIRLLDTLEKARRAAAANRPDRAREALRGFGRDTRALAAHGVLDEREAEMLALGAERAEARVMGEAQPPRARKRRPPADAQPPPTRERQAIRKKRPPKSKGRAGGVPKRPERVEEEREEGDD
jgi:hypothetical protein